ILNLLMQEDFDKKWMLQDLEAVTTKAHRDLSFAAKLGPDSTYSSNPYLKYQYIVGRVAIDRAVEGLSAWLMVDKDRSKDMWSALNTQQSTFGPVYAPWFGKTLTTLNPGEVISSRYPGLSEKIKSLGQVILKSDKDIHLQLMAESLILPAVQLVATKRAIDKLESDRKVLELDLLRKAKAYEADYKTNKEYILKTFEKKADEIESAYGNCPEPTEEIETVEVDKKEVKTYLTAAEVTELDQTSLTKDIVRLSKCAVGNQGLPNINYLEAIRDQYIPKANEAITATRIEYEKAREAINTVNESIVQLHVTHNQLLYTEPYFTVLLNKVSRGSEYKTELLYERIAADYDALQELAGEARITKLKEITKYISVALIQEQPIAVKRILEYIATMVSGDPSALAPLVEVRQQALQWISEWKAESLELYTEQDAKIRDDYGFDLQFEKFADLTYFEAYQLFAVSLLTGQAKISSMKAMKAISEFNHYKVEKLRNLALLDAEKNRIFKELENLDKTPENAAKRASLKKGIWRIEKQILATSRARAWGLGILKPAAPVWLAALAIDSALIGVNYYKNKEYRLFARKVITNASAVGVISYASNIHAANFSDKDLMYTVAVQAATAFTFTNFSFFRGNAAGKMLNEFISPKGSTTINMLVSATGRATMRGFIAAAKSPLTLTRGIGSFIKGIGNKTLSEMLGDTVIRPIINVLGSAIVCTVIEMQLRGYSNPITMFEEEENFRVNLTSFAIIDFILSYVSESNNATKSSLVNFFVSVLGIGITQYIVKEQNWKDFDVQRLLMEGAYVATYSTAKYKLVFKKSVIYFDNYWKTLFAHLAKSGNRQTARKLTTAARFMINVGVFSTSSNFAGNAPFLYMVRDLEQAPDEPEGREHFYADQAYDYILKVEEKSPGTKYSPNDLEEYTDYIRRINESLKNDINSIEEAM
ncbi:MAG: hypothetical protein KDD37_06410, partial [Bdellovibrionales bacterium]|nr:hypothetical protein [Bdellovibrionales bacterium]